METKPQIDLRRRQLKTTNVTYNRIRKSAIKMEIREESKRKWQNQWKETTKGAITKEFFPSVERRLAVNLHLNPNVTTVMSGHGNIRSYLHRLKIIDSPECPCKQRHTNNRPFDISVRKVKVRKRNAEEQCT